MFLNKKTEQKCIAKTHLIQAHLVTQGDQTLRTFYFRKLLAMGGGVVQSLGGVEKVVPAGSRKPRPCFMS